MIDRIFGPLGLLAQKSNSYEYRPEQRNMAQALAKAFAQERFLIVEAGTGTGKTLAYLIPAVLSGKKVVVSTGTKTLQEQLFFSDIPFLQEKLDFGLLAILDSRLFTKSYAKAFWESLPPCPVVHDRQGIDLFFSSLKGR